MKIIMSGATGFIGSHLRTFLTACGYEVAAVGREYFRAGAEEHLNDLVEKAEVVINLAGASVNRRWTRRYRRVLYESRLLPTRKLVEAVNRSSRAKLFISASAVGYYSSVGCQDEWNGVKGEGFLPDLCEAWESEVWKLRPTVRRVILRFGLVMSPDGGVLALWNRLLKRHLMVLPSSGNQGLAWIGLQDLMNVMIFMIERPEWTGIFNCVVPGQISLVGFLTAMTEHMPYVWKIKVPSWIWHLFLGERAVLLTQGQWVKPARLIEAGFCFQCMTARDLQEGSKRG